MQNTGKRCVILLFFIILRWSFNYESNVFRFNKILIDCVFGNSKFLASPRSIVSVSGTINLLFPHTQSISIYYFTGWNTGFYFTRNLTAIYVINKFIQGLLHRFLFSRFTNLNVITILRAPDKLRICVFYAMKTSKIQSVHLRIHIAV